MKKYYLTCDKEDKMELSYTKGKEIIVDYKIGLKKFYLDENDLIDTPNLLKIKTISGKELNVHKKYIISIESIEIVSHKIYFFDNSTKKNSLLETVYKCYSDMKILDGRDQEDEDLDVREYKIYQRYIY